MDGHRFLREVRARPEYSGLRVVMVTRQTSLDHVAKALAAGADEYVMKPFDQSVISDKLALLGFGSPA
jgi:two-component system chemotaxis response regulator CheY